MITWFTVSLKTEKHIATAVFLLYGAVRTVIHTLVSKRLPRWSRHVHTFLSTQQVVSAHHTGRLWRTSTSSQDRSLDRHQSVREIISSRQHLCNVCNYLMKLCSLLAEWTIRSFQVPLFLLTPLLFWVLVITGYLLSNVKISVISKLYDAKEVFDFLMETFQFLQWNN